MHVPTTLALTVILAFIVVQRKVYCFSEECLFPVSVLYLNDRCFFHKPREDEANLEQKARTVCSQFVLDNGVVNKSALLALHHKIDRNNDTVVHLNEYKDWMDTSGTLDTQALDNIYFCENDFNSDRAVRLEEFRMSLKKMDKNGDGTIKQEECVQYKLNSYQDALEAKRRIQDRRRLIERIVRNMGCQKSTNTPCVDYKNCLETCTAKKEEN